MKINFNLNSTHYGTWNHTAGVLGLLQALEEIVPNSSNPYSFRWEHDDRSLAVSCDDSLNNEAWDWLVRQAFQLVDGIITLPGSQIQGHQHIGMLETVLQVPATRPMEGSTRLSFLTEQGVSELNTLKLKSYIHQKFANKLFGRKRVVVTSWLLPNCTMIHPDSPGLNWTEKDDGAISLLFSALVRGHYSIQKALSNKKFLRTTALCTPIVYSLKQRIKLESSLVDTYAGSLADAAYRFAQLNECGVHAYEFKSEAANRPAKIINATEVFCDKLADYDRIKENFPNSWQVKDERVYFYPNFLRGCIAENISTGRKWFEGISEPLSAFNRRQVIFNRGNLSKMFFGQ